MKFRLEAEDDDSPVTLRDGTVLEGAAADAYIEGAIAKIRARNLVPGGKSLSGGTKHSPTVQFRVPETVRDEVEAQAAAEGVTVSRLARKALEQYLAEHRSA